MPSTQQKQALDGKRLRSAFFQGSGAAGQVLLVDRCTTCRDVSSVANPINRYAIGSQTQGFKTNTDGPVDIYLKARVAGAMPLVERTFCNRWAHGPEI